MTAPKKKTPRFKTEDEERAFWAVNDSTAYVDWTRGERAVFPNLRPTTQTISLRLPEMLLADLKVIANSRDVPYQSLLKIFLAERIAQELRATRIGRPGQKRR